MVTLVLLTVFGLFAFVVFFGAPYLPTLDRQKTAALDLLDLKPGQTLLELGCGDGRVLLAAAKRDLRAVGYELNPILALISWLVTWKHRDKIKVVWGNYWGKQWPPADGIFVFLLDKYMTKLDKKVIQTYSGKTIKLVSYAFEIPHKKAAQTKKGLFLYRY